jgi:exopolyphosphatase/pppGpp-phosphohydrolase
MRIGAIDLGSGTIKFSVFEKQGEDWVALVLQETNTELRRGMGAEMILQPGPLNDTIAAVQDYVIQGHAWGLDILPAYGTSALRKAKNREILIRDLHERFDMEVSILSEVEEGRLNLLGAQHRSPLVIDPGGDSTDCAWGKDWRSADTASLPFGSVSLQEKFGHEIPGEAIGEESLEALRRWVKQSLDSFAPALALKKSGISPAIRMNLPIQAALNLFAGGHRGGGLRADHAYGIDDLRSLTAAMAAMTHDSRAQLISGEPVGKVDRTPFGFASWIAILEWMDAGSFKVEPWGIKLGAALVLNQALD